MKQFTRLSITTSLLSLFLITSCGSSLETSNESASKGGSSSVMEPQPELMRGGALEGTHAATLLAETATLVDQEPELLADEPIESRGASSQCGLSIFLLAPIKEFTTFCIMVQTSDPLNDEEVSLVIYRNDTGHQMFSDVEHTHVVGRRGMCLFTVPWGLKRGWYYALATSANCHPDGRLFPIPLEADRGKYLPVCDH